MKFADTSFLLALLVVNDQWHQQALEAASFFGERLVTTNWVLAELANFCKTRARRARFTAFVQKLATEDEWYVVEDSDRWFARGLDLYGRRLDKEWSLTDCISFEVMREMGITEALTADRHFEQAGFRALLR